ncbi:MAG: polysaccharide biosynthesis tyrosine autokinase [Nitrospirae bacterium]|nr:polysaccharide biosynthesis tyrosine autokinase [Nitrospirota bacterium]
MERPATVSFPQVVKIIARRKAIVVLSCVIGVAMGMFQVRSKAPTYEATVVIQVKSPPPSGQGGYFETVQHSVVQAYTASLVITSTPFLLRVAKELGKIPREMSWDDVNKSDIHLGVIKALRSKITANQRRGEGPTPFVEITAHSGEPEEARDVANTAGRVFISYHRDNVVKVESEAREYLDQQKTLLSGQLAEAQEDLLRFKTQRGIVDIAPERQRAIQERVDLTSTLESLQGKEEKLDEMAVRFSDDRNTHRDDILSLGLKTAGVDVGALFESLLQDVTARDVLIQDLTPEHPEIIQIDRRVFNGFKRLKDKIHEDLDQVHIQLRGWETRHAALLKEETELLQLEAHVDMVRKSLEGLDQELQEVGLKTIYSGERAQIIQPAVTPERGFRKQWPTFVTAGLLLGFVMGLFLAFVREAFDFSLRQIEEIEELLKLSVLGLIPRHTPGRGTLAETSPKPYAPSIVERVPLLSFPRSPVSESFRTLRTTVRRIEPGHEVYLVTSASPQEGKSLLSLNLSLAMAQIGLKTLLVEANMRRPTLDKVIGFKSSPGLIQVLQGAIDWHEAVRTLPDLLLSSWTLDLAEGSGLDRLDFIPSGGSIHHPSELIEDGFDNFKLADEWRKAYDAVIFDAPPVVPVTDSATLARFADRILLVYRMGRTPRDLVQRAKKNLEAAGGKILGVIVNDVEFREISVGVGYRYGRYYHAAETTPTRSSRRQKKAA